MTPTSMEPTNLPPVRAAGLNRGGGGSGNGQQLAALDIRSLFDPPKHGSPAGLADAPFRHRLASLDVRCRRHRARALMGGAGLDGAPLQRD